MKEYFIVRINHENVGTLFNNREEMKSWVSAIIRAGGKIDYMIVSKVELNKTFKTYKAPKGFKQCE